MERSAFGLIEAVALIIDHQIEDCTFREGGRLIDHEPPVVNARFDR
jgi:hypothetical protein